MNAPDLIALRDLLAGWARACAAENEIESPALARAMAARAAARLVMPASEREAAAARAEAQATAAAAEAEAGRLPAWQAEGEARAAARLRALAATPGVPEPTLEDAWVAATVLGPLPKDPARRVRLADLFDYFTAAVNGRGEPWLGEDPAAWYDSARVVLSRAWLRRVVAAAGMAAPSWMTTGLDTSDGDDAPVELSKPEQRLRRIEAWLRANGYDPLALRRGAKARAKAALTAAGMDDDAFDRAWQYGRTLTPPRIRYVGEDPVAA